MTEVDALFTEIYRCHHAKAVDYVRLQYRLDYDSAEQIVTDAFLSLYETLSLGVEITHVNTWLRRNISTRFVDFLRCQHKVRRKQTLKQSQLNADLLAQNHQEFAAIECSEVIQQALQNLKPNERRLVDYVLLNDHTLREAAKKFHVCERTAARRLVAVKNKLRVACSVFA